MIRIALLILFACFLMQNCSTRGSNYSPTNCLPPEKQNKLLSEMVRYSSKLPPGATRETKFNPEFNWYYTKAVAECQILYCYLNEKDSSCRLLIAKEARSITPMKEGIALHIKFNREGEFELYDEVFRMWKMPLDTLRIRGKFLFDLMVKEDDLTLYYSKFQEDKYIEFPDDRFRFDSKNRRWVDYELDSIRF